MAPDAASSPPIPRDEPLAALPPERAERLRPRMRHVGLVLDRVLHEPGAPVEDVYVPRAGVVSPTADTGDDGPVEVGMTGREGFLGAAVLPGPDGAPVHRVVVRVPGHTWRMHEAAFLDAVEHPPAPRDRCLRHLQVPMIQTSRSTARDARHEPPERLARRVPMTRDRVDRDEPPPTREFLSFMLGVRRADVRGVATASRSQGPIRPSRRLGTGGVRLPPLHRE